MNVAPVTPHCQNCFFLLSPTLKVDRRISRLIGFGKRFRGICKLKANQRGYHCAVGFELPSNRVTA